jgi:two-component system alkaline phosphatase synthesis response regulator PhoP
MPGTIVIIDNEPHIVKLLESTLNREGYQTFTAEDGVKGLELVRQVLPAMVILELVLPDLDGLSVCKHLRTYKQTKSIPIIIISAKSEEVDRIMALEMGADDFMIKPFFPRELVARIGAVLRRYDNSNGNSSDGSNKDIPEFIETGEIKMDLRQHLVTVRGKEMEPTPREYDLLKIFLSNPDRAFTREYLLDSLWGFGYFNDSRTVDVHVRRLRQKIEIDPAHPVYIETIRRIGYRFRNPRNDKPKPDK